MIPRRRFHVMPQEWETFEQWFSTHTQDPPKETDETITTWENAIAQTVAMPYATTISSGRIGMSHIFHYLRPQPGDEIIIPAYTLADLIPLIRTAGAIPVPADIDPATFNMTAASIAPHITPHTKAILVVHLFGVPAEMPAIMELANTHGIPVVEDCAHAFGAMLNGTPVGSFGFAAFYSFENTKPVNTYGGGAVVSRDKKLIDYIRQNTQGPYNFDFLRKKIKSVRTEQRLFATNLALGPLILLALPGVKNFMTRIYRHIQPTSPKAMRYTPIQAQTGLIKLASLRNRIANRNRIASQYRQRLRPEIRLQHIPTGIIPTWYFLVAILPKPAPPIRLKLLLHGIDTGIENEIADDCATLLGANDCPNTHHLFHHTIALPLFDTLSNANIDRICATLNKLI